MSADRSALIVDEVDVWAESEAVKMADEIIGGRDVAPELRAMYQDGIQAGILWGWTQALGAACSLAGLAALDASVSGEEWEANRVPAAVTARRLSRRWQAELAQIVEADGAE